MGFGVIHAQHIGALRSFDQHFHGAVWQFQHLQDIRHAADTIEIIRAWIIFGRGFLRNQRDALAGFHCRLKGLDGF